eukprot:snap_masked-scaffold_35-processed-gene-0.9-mRNA-1 protein AED:1.00 eAED:1.00 QI:0/0/0/0/1/1/5/0/71
MLFEPDKLYIKRNCQDINFWLLRVELFIASWIIIKDKTVIILNVSEFPHQISKKRNIFIALQLRYLAPDIL